MKSGFGSLEPKWVLYIENRPPLPEYEHDNFRLLGNGEAAEVIAQTSNHWRKVFSIMAKISFALFETNCNTWQEYRDTKLLTEHGFEAISYLPFNKGEARAYFSIVCGFTYAGTQLDLDSLIPHQTHAKLLLVPGQKCLVTPYFDWRQLNNELLEKVIDIMKGQTVLESRSD